MTTLLENKKNLSLPGKEDKRAAALRENLKKRKTQAKTRETKDAETEKGPKSGE